MLNIDEEVDDLFFDSVGYLSFEDCIATKEYEIWLNEPQSVKERRQRFLQGMGLTELAFKIDEETVNSERVDECSGAVSSSSSSHAYEEEDENFDYCARESNSEANFMIDDDMRQEQLDKPYVLHENENDGSFTSLSECESREVEECKFFEAGKQKTESWWSFFLRKRKQCVSMISHLNSDAHKTNRMKVKHNKKKCIEFSGVHMGQELRAHKGCICTMKFSPDGRYLATGGEDGIVRIWHVSSANASNMLLASQGNFSSNLKADKHKRKTNHGSVVIPKKIFHIEESPVCEFYGHSSDVLDLAWSNSNRLLSSSKDKTVRLWQVGFDHCLETFCHTNFVTCIQFNPFDENYFTSGSVDGKVRIWGISQKRVVDWVDAHDVTSCICYQPDGQGLVVGSITGTCRFYKASESDLQLVAEIQVQGRKKTTGNKITGIEFSQETPQRVMISYEDSRIRIFDGVKLVRTYKGLSKSGSQLSASFTSTGRYIISIGEDFRVYVWDYDGICTPSSNLKKTIRSCEHFFVQGVVVAVPWLGMRIKRKDLNKGSIQKTTMREEGASRRRDFDRFSLSNWFFIDGPYRGSSATWPEEKLLGWDISIANKESKHHNHENLQQLANTNDYNVLSDAWGLVIVTAGSDGTIKIFHNYGLPIKL